MAVEEDGFLSAVKSRWLIGRFSTLCVLSILVAAPVAAQQSNAESEAATNQDETESQNSSTAAARSDSGDGRSGYADGPPPVEGRDGVANDLYQDDLNRGSVFKIKALDGTLDPWWNTKRRLKDKYGLKINVTYQSLRMWTDQDDDDAETFADAGRIQFQGAWTALGGETKNPSVITFRMEYRDTLWADIAPSQIGGQFGSAGIVGTGFSAFEFQFRELAWRQTLYSGKWKFATGKISAVSWYNGHALSSPLRGFSNSAILASNTRPFPGRGFGLVNAVRITDKFGVVAGIHDANAVSGDNPFESIDEWEFFYSAEFRWALTTYERHQWDQARIQLWYQEEREESGIPQSQGATFVVSRLFKDRFYPFLFGGHSDGEASQMKTDIGGGIGFAFDTKRRAARDVLGIGINWGDPSNESFQEQVTTELFYRFQLLQNIAFTPSVQYVQDPLAGEPGENVWVFGFRWRMTF